MITIKYSIGQERDIICEKSSFQKSIFTEQYKRAISLLSIFVDDRDTSKPNIMAFCGNRGEGKTSCLLSVIEILKAVGKRQDDYWAVTNPDALELISECNARNLREHSYAVIPLVDPSFFDTSHNVLEIIIGQMYNIYCNTKDGDDNYLDKLETAFQNVKRCLKILSRSENRERSFNELAELNSLSAAIDLRKEMAYLVEIYLNYIKKDILIIPIDDIDLSPFGIYDMCEQIRKFLSVHRCIVMLNVKISQLQEIISQIFKNRYKKGFFTAKLHRETRENPDMDEEAIRAKMYVDKLIPASMRIDMPKAYAIANFRIEILDKDDNVKFSAYPLKNGILELIFRKTRYLFYNPTGGISPILPNNLRELFSLVGLIASMQSLSKNQDSIKTNKNLFKNYFFTVWKDRFDAETQESLDSLLNYDYGTSFNREVVKILNSHFENRLDKDYDSSQEESEDVRPPVGGKKDPGNETAGVRKSPSRELYESIISASNFGYNISIGDVFFLFSMLEKETLSEASYALVFFLKSYYSIKLYEAYEAITEKPDAIFPDILPEDKGLTTVDHRFDHTNILQQIVGGSFFTYSPGELIPLGGDIRIINTLDLFPLLEKIKNEFDDVKQLADKEDKSADEITRLEEFNLSLNIAEYFILATKCAVRRKNEADARRQVPEVLTRLRKNVETFHYRPIYKETRYLMIDVLAPFANILNPKFCYQRFYMIDDEFYDKIFNYPGSLLHAMIDACKPHRAHINYPEDHQRELYHRLLSISVIRNSEVLSAIMENIILNRNRKNHGMEEMMGNFYGYIQKCEMSTHKTSEDDPPYNINFHFLEPLQKLMSKVFLRNDKKETAAYQIFNKIFSSDADPKKKDQAAQKDILKEAIRNRQTLKTVVENILKVDPFSKLNKEQLTIFVEMTIPKFKKDVIDQWVDDYYDMLSDATGDPDILDRTVQDIVNFIMERNEADIPNQETADGGGEVEIDVPE